MKYVAANTDSPASKSSEMITKGQQIEQALRGMLVRSITSIDDVRLDSLSEKLRGTGRAVSNHNHVDSHRLEIARCIDEGLTFEDARARRRDIHRVGGQSLLRKLERDSRASGALEEKIDDCRATKSRNFLYRPLADFLERLGGIENEKYLFARQRLEAK